MSFPTTATAQSVTPESSTIISNINNMNPESVEPNMTATDAGSAANGTASTREGGGLLSFDGEEEWQMENGEPEKSPEEMKQDLSQLEDEINTLKQVLEVKEKKANDIRRKLGITPMQLISDSFYGGLKNIATSSTVQKTSENMKYYTNSYLLEGSKSAASYTKSGLTNISSGMMSGMGSIKNSRIFSSMYGFKPNPSEEEKFVEVIAPPAYSESGDNQQSSQAPAAEDTTAPTPNITSN
ncbi:uncharacterized protein LOC142342920 [Convolutriloba macropyga]|uniref:uncharacterized protein LOC142342920 n=1 Tax=Convolutriloba macropyga TaxID=536237 RepID=UPI003F5241C6